MTVADNKRNLIINNSRKNSIVSIELHMCNFAIDFSLTFLEM